MLLIDYVDRYALETDLARESVEQLRIPARLLTRFAGGFLPLESLTDDLVNRFLVSRQEQGRAADTVHSNRSKILTLWHSAADSGLCQPPGKIRRIKRAQKIPRAFTHDQIRLLLAQVAKLKGNIHHRDPRTRKWRDSGESRQDYWRAFINADYDCGLRRSDVLSIERNWIPAHGTVVVVQSKTKRTHTIQFRPETIAAIDKLCRGRKTGRIWVGYDSRRIFCQTFKRLVRRAGIEGSSKWLRRSSASYVARDFGRDAAKRHLGHTSDGIADASYIDPSIAYAAPPLPPPLS